MYQVRFRHLRSSGDPLRPHARERGLGDLGVLSRSTTRNSQPAGVSVIEPDR